MLAPILTLRPTPSETRLLLTFDDDECLKAILPPPSKAHPAAARTLLEGLSLWFQRPLCVVSSVADEESMSALGLSDGFGFGSRTLHYEVRVHDPQRRGRRLAVGGAFRELRQLALRGLR
jgi:hypothetical protein